MSEWVDFSVYAALVIALWFVLPAWAGRLNLLYLRDRNPDWVRGHAELARMLSSSAGLRVTCGTWGLASLGTLLVLQLDLWPDALGFFTIDSFRWEALKDLNSVLLIVGGAGLLSAAALLGMRVHKMVPRATVRWASLERRTLDDMIGRPVLLTIAFMTGLVLLAWTAAAVLGLYSTPRFWGRFLLLAVMTAVCAFFLRLSVRRPPHFMDRTFGSAFRADEVRFAVALQLLPPVIGAVRLYEEVAATSVVDVSRAMHLGVALLVTTWVFRLVKYSSPGQSGEDRPTGATLRWSTP